MKRMIRQLAALLLACQLFVITAYGKPDWPNDVGILAESGIVMDMDSGAVLYGQNIHVAHPPASITKILTALVVLENCQLDEMVEFSETAVNSVESDSGNKLGSVAGDQLSVEDCLYGMMLVSSNQAANALAEHVAGSISGFVDLMNEKAAELGCEESHFDNPSGLNGDTQYVTAYDMALISRAAYSNETLLEISSTLSRKLGPTANYPGGITVENEHRLLNPNDEFYYSAAKAGKTGYLQAAGNTLVTYAEQDGRRLVSVILRGQPRQYFTDSRNLLEFGFRSFQNVSPAETESRYVTGDEILNLERGDFACSDLMIDPDGAVTLPLGASLDDADVTVGSLPEGSPARAVAQMTYTYNDRVVGTAWLTAKDGVELPGEPEMEDPSAADQPGSQEPETEPVSSEPEETAGRGGISAGTAVAVVLILVAAALAVGAVLYHLHQKKVEAEKLARRREERCRRLEESGEWEEFERIRAMQKSRRAEKEDK